MIDRKRQLEEAVFRARQRVWWPISAASIPVPVAEAGRSGGHDGNPLPRSNGVPIPFTGLGGSNGDDGDSPPGSNDASGRNGAGSGRIPLGPDDGPTTLPPRPKFPNPLQPDPVVPGSGLSEEAVVCTAPSAGAKEHEITANRFGPVKANTQRTTPRTWYLAPQRHWHKASSKEGNNSVQVFDPASPTAPLGSDVHGTGSKACPFASLNRLLHPRGVEPNTWASWDASSPGSGKSGCGGAPKAGPNECLLIPGDTIVMLNGIYDLHPDVPLKDLAPKPRPGAKPAKATPAYKQNTIAIEPLQVPPKRQGSKLAKVKNPIARQVLEAPRAKTVSYEWVETPKLRFATIGPDAAHFGKPNKPITLRAETPGKVIIWGGDPDVVPVERAPLYGSRGFVLASPSYPVKNDSSGALLNKNTKLPATPPGYWRIEGITFRNMRECFTESAGAQTDASYLGWHHLQLKGCRFMEGPNDSVHSTEVSARTTRLSKMNASLRKNLTDPYGTPVTNAAGKFVSVDSPNLVERKAAWTLFHRWHVREMHEPGGRRRVAKGPCMLLLVIDRNGNPYLNRADEDGFSTIRSSLTSSKWLLQDCFFDRVAGLADNWYQQPQRAYPFAKLGYEVGPLPGDAPPATDAQGKPNYLLGACIFGQIVPVLSPAGEIVPGEAVGAAMPRRDWLDHWRSHTHGYYAQGFGHRIEGCTFGNIGLGYCVKIAGHRRALVPPQLSVYMSTESSHVISKCTFNSIAARGGHTFQGHITFYTSTKEVKNVATSAPTATCEGNPAPGMPKKANANRLPHNVLIVDCDFHGPPKDAVVQYKPWHLGDGCTIRRCTTTGPFWTWDNSRVLKRKLVGGEWVLVVGFGEKDVKKEFPIALASQAQAWDTPWRIEELADPTKTPQPTSTYCLANKGETTGSKPVYIKASGELMALPPASNIARIFSYKNKRRQL